MKTINPSHSSLIPLIAFSPQKRDRALQLANLVAKGKGKTKEARAIAHKILSG